MAGSTAFVFIALLVPWWSEGPFSIDGFHSWGWFSFVGFLAALGLLCTRLVRSPDGRAALRLPVPLHQAYSICASFELLGAVLYLALTVRHLGFDNVSAGSFIVLVGAAATLVGSAKLTSSAPAVVALSTPSRGPSRQGEPNSVHLAAPANADGPAFATACAACAACGRPNVHLTRFCEGCGAPLSEPAGTPVDFPNAQTAHGASSPARVGASKSPGSGGGTVVPPGPSGLSGYLVVWVASSITYPLVRTKWPVKPRAGSPACRRASS